MYNILSDINDAQFFLYYHQNRDKDLKGIYIIIFSFVAFISQIVVMHATGKTKTYS